MKAMLLLAALLPLAAKAQSVEECPQDYRTMAASVAEPWENNTLTFAEGAVRLAVMDVIEPAAASYYLLVLSPPYNEVGDRQCRLIGGAELGFGRIDLMAATASYDAQTGLGLDVPVQIYNGETADYDDWTLSLTINQQTGDVTARMAD